MEWCSKKFSYRIPPLTKSSGKIIDESRQYLYRIERWNESQPNSLGIRCCIRDFLKVEWTQLNSDGACKEEDECRKLCNKRILYLPPFFFVRWARHATFCQDFPDLFTCAHTKLTSVTWRDWRDKRKIIKHKWNRIDYKWHDTTKHTRRHTKKIKIQLSRDQPIMKDD